MKVCRRKVPVIIRDWNSIIDLIQFEATIWAKHSMENYAFGFKDKNMKTLKKTTENVIKSNKCNHCEYASSNTGNLRTHLKTHSGEKSNICNQCDYSSSYAHHLRTHLKTHSGEKPNKCNQCDFTSVWAGNLTVHLKTHSGEKLNKCNQCD